jgi:hypothetical protein
MRDAWAPVGLAWEHSRRRFYAEEEIDTALLVTNDDEQFRDFTDLRIQVGLGKTSRGAAAMNLDRLAYYETAKVPLRLRMPASTKPRETVNLLARLSFGKHDLGLMGEPVEIFAREKPEPRIKADAIALGLGPNLSAMAQCIYASTTTTATMKDTRASVLLVASSQSGALAADKSLRRQVEAGATAIVFSPGEQFDRLFPKEIMDRKAGQAEFGDFLPIQGTALGQGLRPMDLKWWGRRHDARLFIASQSHRLTPGGQGRELVRFIPPHSYIGADKLPEQYRTVLFEIPLGRGRLWVCDLDLEECTATDPVAQIFAANLLRAAADPESTRSVQPFPSHEEMLKGNLRSRR